jgi:RHS repeat-associated protein
VDTTPLDNVDAAIEQFLYDGYDIILDFVDPDGSGPSVSQQTNRYLRGPGIDNLIAMESESGTNWILQDHLGSTRAIVSSLGILVQSIDYDSFGKAIAAGSPLTRYLYTGRELDAESGLYYFRNRYYDLQLGRFIQQDPIGFLGDGPNLYSYVTNNPVEYVDPLGLFATSYCGPSWFEKEIAKRAQRRQEEKEYYDSLPDFLKPFTEYYDRQKIFEAAQKTREDMEKNPQNYRQRTGQSGIRG